MISTKIDEVMEPPLGLFNEGTVKWHSESARSVNMEETGGQQKLRE